MNSHMKTYFTLSFCKCEYIQMAIAAQVPASWFVNGFKFVIDTSFLVVINLVPNKRFSCYCSHID